MYEEYMQNFFGDPRNMYQNQYGNMNENYTYSNPYIPYQGYNMGYNPYSFNTNTMEENQNLEEFYPEIYNIIYPMVKKICNRNTKRINKDMLDEMVEEIYNNLETNEGINLNITINNDINKEKKNKELNLENRSLNKDNMLKDLIKILILRELLKRNKEYKINSRMYPLNPALWQDRPYGQY